MKYFSMFSGIGGLFTILNSVILVIWTEKNISENTNENGKLRTENTSWLWNEPDTTHKHQSKKKLKSQRIKNIVNKLDLKRYSTMVANVLVAVKKQLSFFVSTTLTITVQNIGKIW